MTTQVSETHCEKRKISFCDFVNNSLDSLTWYDQLPGDPVFIEGDNDSRTAAEIADELLQDEHVTNQLLIDILAAKLLNQCDSALSYGCWPELAARLSQTMAANLTASGMRSLRMRAQRLVYYIQVIIDRSDDIEDEDLVISETILGGNKAWDYLRRTDGEWWISSDETNIHHRDINLSCQHWRIGLPTQMDLLPDGRLVVGSIYTNGASLFDGVQWHRIEHDAPIVLIFEHGGHGYFVDHYCRIWEAGPHRLVTTVPRPQVHFARYFDGILYLLDNMDYGHITLVDMRNGSITHQSSLPVQVCNDISVSRDGIYLIDKQQGSVFKFNRNWHFERRALRFGRGRQRLLDPVSLREQDGHLQVVSWLTSKLTELKLF